MIEDDVLLQGPDKKGPIKWLPTVRVSRTIPFGYKEDEENEALLQPIEEELELLEEAKVHLKRYGSRQVAAWLSEKSGRYISHTGLIKRVKSERRRSEQIRYSHGLIKRLEKAIETAQKLEESRLGRQEDSTSGGESPSN